MVRPMTSSRSASVTVSDAVWASSELTSPPSPCRILMISIAKLVDVLRGQRREQRLEAVEQHGEVERRLGLRERDASPCPARRGPSRRPGERDVALADQVAVADLGLGADRERAVGLDVEGHAAPASGRAACATATPVDLADADPGDADVVARMHAGRVGEERVVGRRVAEPDVGDGGREQCRWRAS